MSHESELKEINRSIHSLGCGIATAIIVFAFISGFCTRQITDAIRETRSTSTQETFK